MFYLCDHYYVSVCLYVVLNLSFHISLQSVDLISLGLYIWEKGVVFVLLSQGGHQWASN